MTRHREINHSNSSTSHPTHALFYSAVTVLQRCSPCEGGREEQHGERNNTEREEQQRERGAAEREGDREEQQRERERRAAEVESCSRERERERERERGAAERESSRHGIKQSSNKRGCRYS